MRKVQRQQEAYPERAMTAMAGTGCAGSLALIVALLTLIVAIELGTRMDASFPEEGGRSL